MYYLNDEQTYKVCQNTFIHFNNLYGAILPSVKS